MADIKTREHTRDIKVLDKSMVAGERMKDAFIRSKNQVQNLSDSGEVSPSEYAENRLQTAVEVTAGEVGIEAKHQIDKKIEQGRNAYREHRQEVLAERKAKKVDEALKRLRSAAEGEAEDVRNIVKEIVPTYHPEKM